MEPTGTDSVGILFPLTATIGGTSLRFAGGSPPRSAWLALDVAGAIGGGHAEPL